MEVACFQHPRGPGFWKFHASLLEDVNFTDKLAGAIPKFIAKYEDIDDKGLLWERVKMEIRSFTISYSKQKAKRQGDYEKTLLQTAQKLQQQAESLTPDKTDEYEKVKRKLEAISF